jgi:hypothetical protein
MAVAPGQVGPFEPVDDAGRGRAGDLLGFGSAAMVRSPPKTSTDSAGAEIVGEPYVIVGEPHVIFNDAAGRFGPAGESEEMSFFRSSEGNLVALSSRRAS